jgi:Family of unknown function (DUF5683)
MKFGLSLILSITVPLFALAQQEDKTDSVRLSPTDSIRLDPKAKVITIESYAKRFNPRKALLFAAVLPGAGQVYNKKYWKVPLVYGLIGGGIYAMNFYQTAHKKFRNQLFALLNDTNPVEDPARKGYTLMGNLLVNGQVASPENKLNVDQLRNVVNRYRRDRDFSVALMGMIYFAQLIDAHVDAHLKEFDLNPQLKVAVEPTIQPTGLFGRSSGLSVTFTF